ncbi:MAG: hypothetical protein ACJ76J_22715 [Thermoanaerobaculia bacterium]
MSRLDIGPHTHHPEDTEVDPHPASQTFDREINLKAIAWTIGLLVGVALVVHFIVYGLIVGFNRFDDKREPRPSPVAAANEQPEPPLPRLQTTPEGDLKAFREEEDRLLGGIDKAMEEIARRGLGPEVVGGTPQAQTVPPAQPQAGQTPPPQERR